MYIVFCSPQVSYLFRRQMLLAQPLPTDDRDSSHMLSSPPPSSHSHSTEEAVPSVTIKPANRSLSTHLLKGYSPNCCSDWQYPFDDN